jgi:Protein of unknown function (DUF2442)
VPQLVRIRTVIPLEEFTVRLEFTDNTTKEIDLKPYLYGPIFEPMRKDLRLFRAMKVDPRIGTIVWDNGADMDSDVLYKGLTPAWIEQEER